MSEVVAHRLLRRFGVVRCDAVADALVLLGGLWLYVRPRRTAPGARAGGVTRLAA